MELGKALARGATIYDVAARAGVSISTVSLAINAPGRVRPATLERVMSVIDALGYVPRSHAVARARRGAGRIGVVAPFTTSSSYGRLLNGILESVRANPFEIAVFHEDAEATSELLRLPLARQVDGLIVMSIPIGHPIRERLVARDVAIVLVEYDDPHLTSVTVDNVAGGRIVAELLVARGHRHVAFLGHAAPAHDRVAQETARLSGFREALRRAGITLEDRDIRLAGLGADAARVAAADLLATPDRPTAIFAGTDVLAGGVLAAARERGLRVPDDVAVVGFDDSELAEALGLTSVRQPLEEAGRVALQALLAQLADPRRAVQHTQLGVALVERAST